MKQHTYYSTSNRDHTGTMYSQHHSVAVSVDASSFPDAHPITLSIRDHFDTYLRHSYAFSPHVATLSFNTSVMDRTVPSSQVPFKISMPHQGEYDTRNTVMGVANTQGQVLAIPSAQISDGMLAGSLDVRTIDRLPLTLRTGIISV